MNDFFPSFPETLGMRHLFKAFPGAARPLLELHDRVLRDHSPLTIGERELIAAYVSGLNACDFCFNAHKNVAAMFGLDETDFEALVADVDSANVDDKLKPILNYVKKLTLTPSKMTPADAGAVYDAGWDEQALFDAICVCALFNFMNRLVDGSGLEISPFLQQASKLRESTVQQMQEAGTDPKDLHETEPQYTRLLAMWGVEI